MESPPLRDPTLQFHVSSYSTFELVSRVRLSYQQILDPRVLYIIYERASTTVTNFFIGASGNSFLSGVFVLPIGNSICSTTHVVQCSQWVTILHCHTNCKQCFLHAVGVLRKCVQKRGGTAGVLNQRASEGGERERTDYAGPRIAQGHGPPTQRTQTDADTGRRNKRKYMYIYVSKYLIKTLQPAMGHGLDTSGQRTANRPANRCRCLFASIHKKGSRSEVLPDALGRSSKQREPPRNLHRKLWSRKGREIRERSVRNQFGSASSSLCEIPSSSSSSSFYSSRRSRSAFNSYLPYLTASILLGT